MRWPLQPLQPFQQTQLQPPFGQSVDSLCHPWFTTTNVSYRFPILKLPPRPPPCAVLLVAYQKVIPRRHSPSVLQSQTPRAPWGPPRSIPSSWRFQPWSSLSKCGLSMLGWKTREHIFTMDQWEVYTSNTYLIIYKYIYIYTLIYLCFMILMPSYTYSGFRLRFNRGHPTSGSLKG